MSGQTDCLFQVRSCLPQLTRWIELNPVLLLRWLHEEGILSKEKYFSLLECRPERNQVISLLELVTKDEDTCRKFLHVLQQLQEEYCPDLQNWLRNTFPLYIQQACGSSGIFSHLKPDQDSPFQALLLWNQPSYHCKGNFNSSFKVPHWSFPIRENKNSNQKNLWSKIKKKFIKENKYNLETQGKETNPTFKFYQLKASLQCHKRSVLTQNAKIQENLETSYAPCKLIEIRYTELFITNEDPTGFPDQHEYFVLANRRARIYEHNKHQKIKLSELLSPLETESKAPHKVLVTGIAGIGKSLAMQRLMHEWSLGMVFQNVSCAIHFAFREINLVEGPVSFLNLVKRNNIHLQNTAEELCHDPRNLLVILDGLDEFKYHVNEGNHVNSVTEPALIQDLIYSIINGTLLSGANIIVTSRPRSSIPLKAFDRRVVILGFEERQVKEYCLRFYRDKSLSDEVFQYIMKNDNLSGMSFIPLYCFIICTALSPFFQCNTQGACIERLPQTMTEVYRCYLCTIMHHHMREMTPLEENTEQEPIVLCSPPVLTAMKDILWQLGRLAYYSLLENKILFYAKDLQKYGFDPTQLPDSFMHRVFVHDTDQMQSERFAFFHMTLQEHLAALYCVMSITSIPEELIQCLDLWCFGIFPQQPIQSELLSSTLQIMKNKCWENLQMFSRFFMGLLNFRIEGKLKGLVTQLSGNILDPLTNWFKEKIKYEVNQKLLNLLHCLRELQLKEVVQKVASEIDEVNLFKVTLNPSDCTVLYYVLQHSTSKLKTLNLGYTNIGIQGLRKLQPLLHCCQTLYLRYNSLDKEAAVIEADVLKSPVCQVKSLLMCGNRIGSEGVKCLWEALSTNQTLEELYVDITGITDSGLDNLLPCLAKNTTLRLLTIAGNNLSERGKQLLQEVKKHRPNLKILSSFGGDMGLLQAYLDWVQDLKKDPQQLESARNADALRNIYLELGKEEPGGMQNDAKERTDQLKQEISELLQSCSETG
ncbi:NACHT, LRR and PYD domains-containing protein 12-like [Rhinophrynus dorsalis]